MMILLLFMYLQSTPKTQTLVLIDLSRIQVYAPFAIDMNMLVVRNEKGQKTYMSKNMINWDKTAETSFELFQLVYPERAKDWKPPKRDTHRKEIRIDNKTIKKTKDDKD